MLFANNRTVRRICDSVSTVLTGWRLKSKLKFGQQPLCSAGAAQAIASSQWHALLGFDSCIA